MRKFKLIQDIEKGAFEDTVNVFLESIASTDIKVDMNMIFDPNQQPKQAQGETGHVYTFFCVYEA